MGRLFRHLFRLATGVSLVLCIATAALWVRSYWASRAVEFQYRGERLSVLSSRGRLVLSNFPEFRSCLRRHEELYRRLVDSDGRWNASEKPLFDRILDPHADAAERAAARAEVARLRRLRDAEQAPVMSAMAQTTMSQPYWHYSISHAVPGRRRCCRCAGSPGPRSPAAAGRRGCGRNAACRVDTTFGQPGTAARSAARQCLHSRASRKASVTADAFPLDPSRPSATIPAMGIYDRDYYRQSLPRGGFGTFSAWSVTTWLIVLNVGIFLLDGVLRRAAEPPDQPAAYVVDDGDGGYEVRPHRARRAASPWMPEMGPLERAGYFSVDKAVYHGQVWRAITCQFLHASPIHLFGNMLALFLFGPIVEAHYGARRYLAFYLLCGLAGVACYLLMAATHVLVHDPATPLIGASAGIFGLLVAAAMIAPDVRVYVYWGIPVTIRWLAIGGMALAAYTVFTYGGMGINNAGGEAAHFGGGALGFLLMKNQHWLDPFAPGRPSLSARGPAGRRRRRAGLFQKDWSKDLNR